MLLLLRGREAVCWLVGCERQTALLLAREATVADHSAVEEGWRNDVQLVGRGF